MNLCCGEVQPSPEEMEPPQPIAVTLPVHRPLDPSGTQEEQQQSLAEPESGVHGELHLTLVVIGKVETTTARVLVEVLEGGEVTCQLRCTQLNVRRKHQLPDGTSDQERPTRSRLPPEDEGFQLLEVTQRLPAGKPRIFKFKNLRPDARYEVSIKNLAHLQPASQFRTLLENWTITPENPTMTFAAVSCNLLSETLALDREKQIDLWSDLAERVQRDEIDYVLHMGDQVYADEFRSDDNIAAPVSAFAAASHAVEGKGLDKLEKRDQLVFEKAMNLIKGKDRSQWPQFIPTIEELYRELYRETWSHRGTAIVLANVPNLTIYDDHDFVDNWGSKPHRRDKDPTSADFFVALRARQVYWEYQGALVRDVDLSQVEKVEKDHHFHAFGEYGVIMTECRGAGSFRYDKNDKTPYLGAQQWRDLEEALAPGGMMDKVKHLLLVCPVPVVYLPHALNAFSEPMVEDALGHWACKPYRAEQSRMLNLALSWQEGRGFGDRLKQIEPPAHPKKDPETIDLDAEHGLHQTIFHSIVGEPLVDGKPVSPTHLPRKDDDDEKKCADSSSSTPPTTSRALDDMLPSPCISNRRVTFLGGDVHVGGHTRIFKHGHVVFDQLVSSAISNHILPTIAFKIGEMIQNAYTELDDGWSFEHAGFQRHRNFGLIETKRPDQQDKNGSRKPIVDTSIVYGE